MRMRSTVQISLRKPLRSGLGGVCRRGLRTHPVQGLQELRDVVALVEVHGADEALGVRDVRELGDREPEDVERPVHRGVRAGGEGDDLQPDVRQGRGLHQPGDLVAHDTGAADRAAQNRFIHHHPQHRCVRAGQQGLPLQAQRHDAVDVRRRSVRHTCPQDGCGVVLGLQEAGDVVRLIGADQVGFALQADEGAEPFGQHIAEPVPPARLVGLAGEVEEAVDLVLLADAVGRQQLLDVREFEADLGLLHAPNRGVGHIEGLGGSLKGQSRLLTQVLQSLSEHHPQDGRRTGRPWIRHVRSPPTSFSDQQCVMPSAGRTDCISDSANCRVILAIGDQHRT